MTVLLDEHGTPKVKVLVAVPCGDQVAAGFAQDLALLMGYTTFVKPDLEVRLDFLRGTYLPRARAALVRDALDHTVTHILWLDSDMRFPKDTLLRLLAHGKPIVAANYPTRTAPILPTALDGETRVPIFTHDGLVEATCCGMGVMLTSIDVFLALRKPWFAVGYNRDADDYAGEDTFFCQRAREANFAVWIDGALSEQVTHTGSFEYQMEHARMTLAAAREQQRETA